MSIKIRLSPNITNFIMNFLITLIVPSELLWWITKKIIIDNKENFWRNLWISLLQFLNYLTQLIAMTRQFLKNIITIKNSLVSSSSNYKLISLLLCWRISALFWTKLILKKIINKVFRDHMTMELNCSNYFCLRINSWRIMAKNYRQIPII